MSTVCVCTFPISQTNAGDLVFGAAVCAVVACKQRTLARAQAAKRKRGAEQHGVADLVRSVERLRAVVRLAEFSLSLFRRSIYYLATRKIGSFSPSGAKLIHTYVAGTSFFAHTYINFFPIVLV